MRSQSLTTMLLYEAKRRPEIAELIERVHSMTDEEIDSVKVPLPWYRKALKEMKAKSDYLEIETRVLSKTKFNVVPDTMGSMREWIGEETWVNIKRGNQLLVGPGNLLWFPDTGGVWIGTIFVERYEPSMIVQSRVLGAVTKTEYRDEQRRRLGAPVEVKPEVKPEKPWTIFRI